MAPEASDKKAEKSYLTSAVDSINPWAGKRAPSPSEAPETKRTEAPKAAKTPGLVDPGDHSITHLYGQSFRTYPSDCPPLHVQWYHAIDVCIGPKPIVSGKRWMLTADRSLSGNRSG